MPIAGLITAEELREAIGKPTADPTEAGSIADEALQRIVDRYTVNLQRGAYAAAVALSEARPSALLPSTENVAVATLQVGGLNIAKGTIADTHVPLAIGPGRDGQGREVAYQQNVEQAANSVFPRRRYAVRGGDVYACPHDVGTITLALVPIDSFVGEFMGEHLRQANDHAVRDARRMLEYTRDEGSRLEGTDYHATTHDQ